MPKSSLKDPKRKFPPSTPDFKCLEKLEEGEVGSVSFHWTVQGLPLQVSCRGRSVGVLAVGETAVDDDDIDYEQVDSNFFDSGYTLAGKTGFQVWAGSRLLMEALTTVIHEADAESCMMPWRNRIAAGAKVLELGSGTGVAGLSLAAAGAQVILTDLKTLVDNSIVPNLELNKRQVDTETIADAAHWMKDSSPLQIGKGWAGSSGLDWTKPVSDKLLGMIEDVALIVACDCVWLKSMLDALFNTVATVFETAARSSPALLLSFQRRDSGSGDGMFTTVDGVVAAIKDRGWSMECLTWRTVSMDGKETDKEVFVLEIKPK